MSDDDKLKILFDMLDTDEDGKLSALELADSLRKIDGDVEFEESVLAAVDQVMTFDTNEDGLVDLEEFEKLGQYALALDGLFVS